MKLGIVGSEAAKFTPGSEAKARRLIRQLISGCGLVISGGCHLGGIDIWAVEEAKALGVPYKEYPPKSFCWSVGYKPRNMLIAENSDEVVCITVRNLPQSYAGMKFLICYHCGTDKHVKSGGCWTVKYAKSLGKPGKVLIIPTHS